MEGILHSYPLVLLCGGKSSRMGNAKGLLEVNGSPWFLEHIRQFQIAGGYYAVVVLGYHYQSYMDNIRWNNDINDDTWKQYNAINLAIVRNKNPQYGQFSSIICAFDRLVQNNFSGAFVLPVDMLPPGKKTWSDLASCLTGSIDVCIPTWNGKGGHPVLISDAFMRTLVKRITNPTRTRLDHEIKKLQKNSIKYVVTDDQRIVGNINTLREFNDLMSGN